MFDSYDHFEMSAHTMLARTGTPTIVERIVDQRMLAANRELPRKWWKRLA
uniref:Uncharacterized protein n=1 Tax=Arundo donax TaxID=35708 RepID=A0A0A8ZZD5_ARUDO